MIDLMISQSFLVAQVWIPPTNQMYQPSRNYPWGAQPPIVQQQRPGYSRVQPSRSNRPDKKACFQARQYVREHGSPSLGPYEPYHKAFWYYLHNDCRQYFGPL